MPKLLCGGSGCGKSTRIFEEMAALAAQKKRSILIVPENMSHGAERRLLLRCGNAASRYAAVSSFSRLTDEILLSCGKTVRTLDGGGKILSMYRALSAAEGRLCFYRGSALKPRLVSAMLETADELIAAGVSPEKLLAAAQSSAMSDKVRDIAVIFEAYAAVCAQSGLDPALKADRAADLIPESGLFRGVHIFIDDFAGFSEQKYAFIARLLRSAADMTVSLLYDGCDTILFAEQFKTFERLRRQGVAAGRPFETVFLPQITGVRPPELEKCAEVFSMQASPLDAVPEAVSLLKAGNAAEECELCAALIRKLTLTGEVRLRDIAVTSGDIDAYTPLLEGAFLKYGIPAFFSRKENILKMPVISDALGALDALEDDLRQSTVLHYIKNGLSPFDRDGVRKLENYALLWGIDGSRWLSPFTKPTCGFDRPREDEDARLAAVEEMRQLCMAPVLSLRKALKACRDGSEYARAFSAELAKNDLPGRINVRIRELSADGLRQEAAEYAQLYGVLTNALAQMEAVLAGQPMDTGEFYRLLTLTLSQYDVGSIPSSLDSVTACSLTSLSSSGIRHLFLLGARDGLLPPAAPSKSILSESERIALEGEGIRLSRDADKAMEQQSDIYRALCCPEKTLTVLYPLADGDGQPCSESYVVSRLTKLLPGLKQQARFAGDMLPPLRLTAEKPAFEQACRGISDPSAVPAAALAFFSEKDPGYFRFLRAYAAAPRAVVQSASLLHRLYGDTLSITASRVEKFNSCRFSYFCQYGLAAKKREEARLDALKIGDLIHSIVEKAVPALCAAESPDPRATARRLSAEAVAALRGADTPRLKAILAQVSECAEYILSDIWEEIEASDFKPRYFEYNFNTGGDAPPLIWEKNGFTFKLNGKADRIDVFDGKLKIVDYKTGTKDFALCDLINGKNLQPFIYMLLSRNAGLGENCAALYIPAKNPFLSVRAEDANADGITKERRKNVRRKGLVRSEPEIIASLEHTAPFENPRWLPVSYTSKGNIDGRFSTVAAKDQMEAVCDYTLGKVQKLSAALSSGDVSTCPKGETACRYCDFRTACHFDATNGHDAAEPLCRLNASQVLEMIGKGEDDPC